MATTNADITQAAASIDAGGKYLTFKLADEEYGVEILKVREINGVMDITAVPRMPAFMKGVINLRQGDPRDRPAAQIWVGGDRAHRTDLYHRGRRRS